MIRRSVTITTVESWTLVWVLDEDPDERPWANPSVVETDASAQEVTEVTSDVSQVLPLLIQSVFTQEDDREIKNREALNDGQRSPCVDEPGPGADGDGAEQRPAD